MVAATLQSKQLAQISGYSTAASWLVNVWEWFIRLDDEVIFIWPMAHTAYIKWLYFFGKYFGLAVQTGVFAIQVVYFANHSMSLENCRIYRALEMVASTLLMLCFDIVLLLRIYGLYGRYARSCVLATCAVVVECVTTVITILVAIPTAMYDPTCAMIQVPKTLILFVCGTFTSQSILLWLAYRKRRPVARPRASIAWVTIRDGMLVFVCISAFLAIVLILILHDSPTTTVMIFFLPMFASLGACHIILNIQRVPHVEATQQFTTDIWGLDRSGDSFLLSDDLFQSRPSW